MIYQRSTGPALSQICLRFASPGSTRPRPHGDQEHCLLRESQTRELGHFFLPKTIFVSSARRDEHRAANRLPSDGSCRAKATISFISFLETWPTRWSRRKYDFAGSMMGIGLLDRHFCRSLIADTTECNSMLLSSLTTIVKMVAYKALRHGSSPAGILRDARGNGRLVQQSLFCRSGFPAPGDATGRVRAQPARGGREIPSPGGKVAPWRSPARTGRNPWSSFEVE